MKKLILISFAISLLIVPSLALAAITINPQTYTISVYGGETNYQNVRISNTYAVDVSVKIKDQINYTGGCNYEPGDLSLTVGYCDIYGLNCLSQRNITVPNNSFVDFKIKHVFHSLACPGTYTITTTIEYEKPLLATGTATFLFKQPRQAPIRGPAEVYLNEDKVKIVLLTAGKPTREYNIVQHTSYGSLFELYRCNSTEWGWFNLVILRNSVYGFGRYTFFIGNLT